MNRYEVMTRAAEPVEVLAEFLEIKDSGDLIFFLRVDGVGSRGDFTQAFAAGTWTRVKRVERENHENQK